MPKVTAHRTGKVLINAGHGVDQTIAERELHKKFNLWGLSLPIPIEDVIHECDKRMVTTHWCKPTDWIRTLMKLHPESLTGGFKREKDIECQLRIFWRYFQQVHPEHLVFSAHSHRLHRVLPLALFGDEGRGPKRGQFLVWTVESLLGIHDLPHENKCQCKHQLGAMPQLDTTISGDDINPENGERTDFFRALLQSTNNTGHSYLTRHVIFGLPSFLYKTNPEIEHRHIQLLAEDCKSLFTSGVLTDGARHGGLWFGAILGSEGDFKHQTAIGNLERSYHRSASRLANWCAVTA